jgi:hypothetical protein
MKRGRRINPRSQGKCIVPRKLSAAKRRYFCHKRLKAKRERAKLRYERCVDVASSVRMSRDRMGNDCLQEWVAVHAPTKVLSIKSLIRIFRDQEIFHKRSEGQRRRDPSTRRTRGKNKGPTSDRQWAHIERMAERRNRKAMGEIL